ncbi:hypothetical protein ACET3X_002204 [Alternaria dauci]|uniref:Uncharacterized protein n=1 Tax=Alternaria dauci TaxID=48095 RepID=A0ABR3UPG4_9PLEO
MTSEENAFKKKPLEKSMTNRKQKKPAATPQAQRPAPAKVSAETTPPIAAAAPQAVQFTSFAQAMQAAATRLVPHNYTPPANDPSFPKDDAAHKVYIRRMYDAYIDTSQCIDRATVPTFDSQLAKHSSHPHSAPITPVMISTICWHLLSIAMDLHTRGPVCLNVFDPAKLKQVYAHRGLTFEKRIDAVCELLRTSKSRCVSLLKLDGLGMVVANAPMLCRQARANHASNGQRQDFLVNGKDAGRKRMAADMDRDEAEMGHASELDEY